MIFRAPYYFFACLAFCKFAHCQDQAAANSVEELTAKVRDSLVVVSQIGRDGNDQGVGSGFIISADGLIATCNHVIGESRELKVMLADGTEFEATAVHAWDAKLDLAVLRIDPGDLKLQPLELGDSDTLAEGQRIITIGNPHGLSFSVVEGLVSAIREIEEDGPPMIQVAIPVEPGNSGGPLIDLNGKVFGIVSMKSTVTDNIGFASPSNSLTPLLEKPNTVPMQNWVTIGALNSRQWEASMGARWRQRAGKITADSPGKGFGGRSLCISQKPVPALPYEVEVNVRLDDESGAAGLAFESDGGDLHYGFYPSSGQIRLTRFDGPDVYSWNVIKQIDTPAYRPGEWNHLRVRVTQDTIIGFVNGVQIIEIDESQRRTSGKAGLAKFRNTRAEFKGFRIGEDLTPSEPSPETIAQIEAQLASVNPSQADLTNLASNNNTVRSLLKLRQEKLAAEIKELAQLADAVHRKDIEIQMLAELDHADQSNVNLARAALLVSKLDNPDLDLNSYLEELNLLTEGATAAVAGLATDLEKLKALSTFLFEQNGFHGSRSAFYSRSNSYLNEVIDDREGIPITLSVIYLEIANRLGIKNLHGIGLPGQFMVRHDSEITSEHAAPKPHQQFIDVFGGGVFVTSDEAGQIAGLFGALGESADQYEPASKRDIISRMLTNLKGIAIEEQNPSDAFRYVDLLLALNPDDPSEHLSRALLLAQIDRPEQALSDLDWIFEKKPEGIDLERLREFYEHLKSR